MPTTSGHRPTVSFPAGTHAAATWTVPAAYGGMTSALLRRSRAFAREAGVDVRVLTFDPLLDVAAARSDLEARGELVPGVTLHNVWEDVRALSDDEIAPPPGAVALDLPSAGPGEIVRVEGDGEDGAGAEDEDAGESDSSARRILHFRADGTLAAADERRALVRRITTYTRGGRAGRSWTSAFALYRAWVDVVLPVRPGFVIVDSKTMVEFFAALRSRHTSVLHLVHGAHLAARATDAHGPLTVARTPMVEHVDDFDGVVFLTQGQRADVLERVGPRDNTYVVPNSTDLPAGPTPDRPEGHRGAVLASLNGRKRVAHAIDAVRRAREATGLDVGLDVFGDGPNRERLEAKAAKVPGVVLHGFVRGAADRLAEASFLLLTSRAEGLPLVFAEAMSRGCVPIAYDIRYGPADIITDGVDGFLVPDGDVDALAAAIERFVRLDAQAVRRMRRAAVATAQGYSDAAVVARWADVLADVARRRPRRGAGRGATSLTAPRSPADALPPQGLRRLAGMLRRAPR
ncbi:glycosyltransferase [Isoptericola sp. BMS4]|uniref:glycosyltransferase n=1 Tax=Isoptericola sp. BMS4 TaxID=2527875 RepID=UPI00141F6139|nr:glycosyltransferase [Isoptericola sp. BMS4]